jgi:hypothetical protein
MEVVEFVVLDVLDIFVLEKPLGHFSSVVCVIVVEHREPVAFAISAIHIENNYYSSSEVRNDI